MPPPFLHRTAGLDKESTGSAACSSSSAADPEDPARALDAMSDASHASSSGVAAAAPISPGNASVGSAPHNTSEGSHGKSSRTCSMDGAEWRCTPSPSTGPGPAISPYSSSQGTSPPLPPAYQPSVVARMDLSASLPSGEVLAAAAAAAATAATESRMQELKQKEEQLGAKEEELKEAHESLVAYEVCRTGDVTIWGRCEAV